MAKLSDERLKEWTVSTAEAASCTLAYADSELAYVLTALASVVIERGNCLRALDEAIVHLDRVQNSVYAATEVLKEIRARHPL